MLGASLSAWAARAGVVLPALYRESLRSVLDDAEIALGAQTYAGVWSAWVLEKPEAAVAQLLRERLGREAVAARA
jgi:hypothetical protein